MKKQSLLSIIIPLVFLLFLSSFCHPIFAADYSKNGFSYYLQIGTEQNTGDSSDSREFSGGKEMQLFDGEHPSLSTIRKWIGHSTCATCTPGTTKRQQIKLAGLTPNAQYFLLLKPAHITSAVPYVATINDGTVFMGNSWVPPRTGPIKDDPNEYDVRWVIGFTPKTSGAILTLENNQTQGDNYIYIDAIVIFSNPLNSMTEVNNRMKNNLPDGLLNKYLTNGLNHTNGGMNWIAQYWQQYMYAYELTQDVIWLDKLVKDADKALSQRDNVTKTKDYKGRSGPVWSQRTKKYVWVGLTGYYYNNFTHFAYLVEKDPSLWQLKSYDGKTYREKAREYVAEAEKAVLFHKSLWQTNGTYGYYVFENDVPVSAPGEEVLLGKIYPFNLNSMMMINILYLSKYFALTGDTTKAETYLQMVASYAAYFKSQLSLQNNSYVWKYSTYYDNNEDLSHASINIEFFYLAYKNTIVFTREDMVRFANTQERLIDSQFNPNASLVDGTSPYPKPQFYFKSFGNSWPLLSEFSQSLYSKNLGVWAKSDFCCRGSFIFLPYVQRPPSLPVSPTPTQRPNVSPTPAWKKGDFNKDGKVNVFDYNAFISNFGKANVTYNMTGSTLIDIFDYNTLISVFGK